MNDGAFATTMALRTTYRGGGNPWARVPRIRMSCGARRFDIPEDRLSIGTFSIYAVDTTSAFQEGPGHSRELLGDMA